MHGRRQLGAFYTPPALATSLAAATLGPLVDGGRDPASIRVCDPAVGDGALLSAAVSYLVSRGADQATASANMTGLDIDPAAVSAARRALGPAATLAVGDALAHGWGDGFDAVLANPPFLGQLKRDTARSRTASAAARSRFGAAGAGYADTAALFLMLAVELAPHVGIILPAPMLGTGGSATARRRVGEQTRLVVSWTPEPGTFEAGVHTVVLVMQRSPSGSATWREGRWNTGPSVDLRSSGVVGDIAVATADFRDQFYAVAGVATEGGAGPALVTCGLIEPGWLQWGTRPARIGRRVFAAPRADLDRLDAGMRSWAGARLVPKVVLATQTRVLEAVADEDGTLLPVVPVISVACPPERVWHLLAVLLAPPVAGWARAAYGGSALSPEAVKLSARQVSSLPLPADRAAWDSGAALAAVVTSAGRAGSLEEWRTALGSLGEAMSAAYGVDGADEWWAANIDRRAGQIERGAAALRSGAVPAAQSS